MCARNYRTRSYVLNPKPCILGGKERCWAISTEALHGAELAEPGAEQRFGFPSFDVLGHGVAPLSQGTRLKPARHQLLSEV